MTLHGILRTAGLLALLSMGAAAFGIAPAQAARPNSAFTVGNYPVQATDTNAVVAKDKALADGQKAAFRSLLKRLVPVTAYKQISRLNSVKAADMISGVSVRSERNSSTEYIASLDFAFQPDAVRAALQSQGIPFVENQAEAVTVVTVIRPSGSGEAKGDTGSWHQAWSDLDLEHTLTPVKLEDLKPVIHSDTLKMLTDGDDNALRIITGEYKTDRVVFAFIEPDPAAKKMVVTLAGQDAVGPILLKRTYRTPVGDTAYAAELAAVVALGVLEGRWKAVKATAPGDAQTAAVPSAPAWSAAGATSAGSAGDPVALVVEFSSLAQWNDIRTQLLDTPGVEDMNISTMSARNADVALRYPGGVQGLANALGGRGLTLSDSTNGWILRSSY